MNIGDKLPVFQLPAVNPEREITNFDFTEKYALLVVVTCNHCPTARAYWKRIIDFAKKYEEDSLGVVAISANDIEQYPQDSPLNMKELSKELKMPFPYLYDETQEFVKSLGAKRTPEVCLFNRDRQLVYKGAIDDNWENEHAVMMAYLEDAIEYCLDGLEIDYPETESIGCSIKWKPEV